VVFKFIQREKNDNKSAWRIVMLALRQLLGLATSSRPAAKADGDRKCGYGGPTKDQRAYLHELADEERQTWKKHDQELANKQK
jgi:hypothetical protein